MSTIKGIFEPFKDYVQDQLRIRKNIMTSKNIGVGVLPQLFGAYIGKQCTIRMASGVNVRKDPNEDISPLLDNNSFEKTLHGNGLAKNWVLEGGMMDGNKETFIKSKEQEKKDDELAEKKKKTLYYFLLVDKDGNPDPNGQMELDPFASSTTTLFDYNNPDREIIDQTKFNNVLKDKEGTKYDYVPSKMLDNVDIVDKSLNDISKVLRGGIGRGGAYGDPKLRANYDDGYGIVPMPGITDAEIRTKSNDGSLRESTINYFCHNRRQLEILETLYMRVGYPVLLEWGWNPYVSNNKTIENGYPILDEFFESEEDFHSLNELIKQRKIDSGGNYDGFVGFVKNFSFKATGDGTGGFECVTELTSQGEILESLKASPISIPVPKEGRYSRNDDESQTEVESSDQFLLLLRSMKKNLDRAGDQRYITTKGSEDDEITTGDRIGNFFSNLWTYGISTNPYGLATTMAVTSAENAGNSKSEKIRTQPINQIYQDSFRWVTDTIKEIMKVTDKDLKKELESVNSRAIEYGYDSFLYGTFIQEISMTEDVTRTENDKITGKDKSIYVRWDLICQLINKYVIPSYKSKTTPLTELTYLNTGERVFNYDKDKNIKIPKGEEDNKNLKFYLDYSLPADNKLHPLVNKQPLKNLLGQSFDYDVCIMPHQFDDSLIVHKYDSSYQNTIDKMPELNLDDLEFEPPNPEYQETLTSPTGVVSQLHLDMTNTGYNVVTLEEMRNNEYDTQGNRFDPDAPDANTSATFNAKQESQNEEENYQPLTSYDEVKFSNKSIGLVYFNLDYLIDQYTSMATEVKKINDKKEIRLVEDFDFLTFITKIWEDVNGACAGYYDFSLQTEHDRPYVARIVDKTLSGAIPVDSPEFKRIFQFEPQGLSSQLRDFVFSSKISNEMSSTISIAAQAPNSAKSLEALSFKSFHKNIENRFTSGELDPIKIRDDKAKAKQKLEDLLKEYTSKFKTLESYQTRANSQYRATTSEDLTTHNASNTRNVDSSTAISLASSLEELCIDINSRFPLEDVNGKPHPKAGMLNPDSTSDRNAIIPLEFALQMDGISGISPLNLFKILKERLPLGYQRDDIAFIVKGESHKITAGQDWTIELDGQLTLLNSNTVDEGTNEVTEDKKEENDELKSKELDELDKNSPPEVPDGADPAPIVNDKKVGKIEATNTKLYKKYKFDVRFTESDADSKFSKLKPFIDKGDLVLVGDGNSNSKFLTGLTTNKLTGGKHYLHKGCSGKFKSWMADLDKQGINYSISSTIRWGKNTGSGPHSLGLAVDFNNLYQDAKKYAAQPKKYKDVYQLKPNLEARKNSSTYKLIAESGKKFGFYNPWRLSDNGGSMDELWHFEYWGDPA